MTVDERARQQLYRKLQEILGEKEATSLMERLPPEGYDQLATKGDLELLEHKLRGELHELRSEMHRAFRTQTIALTTTFAILNGVVFTALALVLG